MQPPLKVDRLRERLRPSGSVAPLFWPYEAELDGIGQRLGGRVLNAGAGDRDISPLIAGEVVNQDIPHGLHPGHIDIWAPLDAIPVDDGHFDGIVCNAVLEHVLDPEAVMAEFARVLRPGGLLYLTVPFMQPEHRDPTDSQRYTIEGLTALCDRHGFETESVDPVHSVETTFAWLVREWLQQEDRLGVLLVLRAAYAWLHRTAARSQRQVVTVASSYRCLAHRR